MKGWRNIILLRRPFIFLASLRLMPTSGVQFQQCRCCIHIDQRHRLDHGERHRSVPRHAALIYFGVVVTIKGETTWSDIKLTSLLKGNETRRGKEIRMSFFSLPSCVSFPFFFVLFFVPFFS